MDGFLWLCSRDGNMIFDNITLIFVSSLFFLLIMRRVSFKFNLVDKPNHRKIHSCNTPLVGGMSIYLAILLFHFYFSGFVTHSNSFMAGSALLLCVGVIDDLYDLPVIPRVIVQTLAAIIIMADGVYLRSLGHLWFGEEVLLGFPGYFITLLAIWAVINAFNMVDGIDGLLAGLSIITFAGLALCFTLARRQEMANYCLFYIAAILPFMLLNIGLPFGTRLKVFMGDAGSTFMGFAVVWLIIVASQREQYEPVFAPATGLWLLSLPLMDMAAVMLARMALKKNPFRPDRTHLHHLLISYGFSPHKTLITILMFSLFSSIIGILLEMAHINEILSVLLFITMFFTFVIGRNHLSRIAQGRTLISVVES